MKQVLLVKYGEIALRKGNRSLFEKQLAGTIKTLINDSNITVKREQGRLLVENPNGDIDLAILEKIRRIFGITAICIAQKLEDSALDNLKKAALLVFKNYLVDKKSETAENSELVEKITFKAETKRSDKSYPMQSREISAAIGEYILENVPNISVNVRKPSTIIWVEIRNSAYVYTDIIVCEAGLPYGSTGKGVLLLSGGIDSPVAGYLMARRGVEIVPVYFHSPPYTSENAKEKVLDIMECLRKYTGQTPLYVVPFTETQLYIYKNLQPSKMSIFLKRAMWQIASQIAEQQQAQCLITGDSIGQVASQTMRSIAAIDTATALTVIRPLSAMDKEQIIKIAEQIGTFDISIRPYEDCCTVFVPKHPETKPNAAAVAKMEGKHPILQEMYAKAVKDVEILTN